MKTGFQCMTAGRSVLVATFLVAGIGFTADAEPTREDLATLKRGNRGFVEVAKKAVPAVVFVTVERTFEIKSIYGIPLELFEEYQDQPYGRPHRHRGAPPQFRQEGQGSGFLISKDGFILSNSHVVRGADKITVRLHDGRILPAKLIGADPHTDVAVLKIDGHDFPFLTLGDSDAIEVGEWVIAVGNPFGLNESLSVGVVSAKGRSVGLADNESLIQTDAAINPGNSGGPLLDIDGKVIGITSSIFSQSGGYMGIGFAVPINMAASIREEIVKTGRIVRGFLGVLLQDLTPDLAKSFDLDKERGLLVSEVFPDSPALKAGLKPGDVILEQEGKKVEDSVAFLNGIARLAPGSKVKLLIRRDSATKTLVAEVGQQQDGEEPVAKSAPDSLAGRLGVTVQTLNPELRQQLNVPESAAGVVVSDVLEGSPAARIGLIPGDLIMGVNRIAVETADEFMKALEQSRQTNRVLLLVKNRQYTRFVVIPLD